MQSNVLSCTHRSSNVLFKLSNRSNSLILNSAICHPPKRSPPREPLLPRPTFRASDFSRRNKAVHRQNAIDQSISDLPRCIRLQHGSHKPRKLQRDLICVKEQYSSEVLFYSNSLPFFTSPHSFAPSGANQS